MLNCNKKCNTLNKSWIINNDIIHIYIEKYFIDVKVVIFTGLPDLEDLLGK